MSSSGSAPKRRPRQSKGPQPKFFDDPNTHRLLAIITALAGEVSVLKERLDTHERLAAAGQVATPEAIEGFEPDDALEDEREEWRSAFLSRVFRVLDFDDEAVAQDPERGDRALDQIADQFAGPRD